MQVEIPVPHNSQAQQEEEKVNLEIESFSKISEQNKINLSEQLLSIAEENANLEMPESEEEEKPESSSISSQSGPMLVFKKEDDGKISA